jgi:aminopeptidase YwaD
MGIELLAMNGEDYYGANGELLYLELNQNLLGSIALFINMDGLGYIKGRTAFSFYNLLEENRLVLESVITARDGLMQGEQWYQGDHMVLVMNGVAAVAVTTEHFMEMEREFAHTAKDVPELVSPEKLAVAACAVRDMVAAWEKLESGSFTGR